MKSTRRKPSGGTRTGRAARTGTCGTAALLSARGGIPATPAKGNGV
jgi:hypothetical protein